ncbi:VOC family protein [Vibrio sp. SCSIO 43135]|uniref:VOC family protein n=1 Tax=Vibrio sp. SCSIO 43135 TaxID=2819096 RepID=UPI0020759EB8|nr:VOC family protein [Vibrio sp. SCSIO 43135]USD41010.1 VOC family protein [Vibrio sp. SCSIO 43135]
MKEISRINHIGLRVSSFETARDFYSQLGFEYITGPSGPEPVAIVEHPSGININFILNSDQKDHTNMLMDTPIKHTGFTHVALEISNKEAVLEHLKALQIPLSGEPMNHPTGTSFFIRDPDNNVIEFIEYKGLSAFQ